MRNRVLILIFLAALFTPALIRAQAVMLKADSITVPCHSADTFLVPIRLYNFTNVGGLQFSQSWNPAHLDYAYITKINSKFQGIGFDTINFINQGKFTFSWTTIGGVSVPDTTILFSIAFARIGGPLTLVSFSDMPTPIVAVDPQGNDLVVQTSPGAIIPVDNVPPTISCPANLTLAVTGPTPVNNIPPQAVDNCAIAATGWTSIGATTASFPTDPDASGAIFNIGQSTVTYTTNDVGGNKATCSFTINLELQPGDSLTIIASNTTASCGQTATIDITALNFDSLGGLQFSLGWDPAILQYASVGNFNPALQLAPANFGINQTGNGFLGFAWTSALANGTTVPNGAVLFSITFNLLTSNATNIPIQFGSTPTDPVAFSSATLPPTEIGFLTVNGSVAIADIQPPNIICPANVSVTAPTGNINATVNNLQPAALSDNCGGTVGLSYQLSGTTTGQGQGPANGVYNAGSTTVVYTATDPAGNTSTCSFIVYIDAGTPLTLQLDTAATDCQAGGSEVCVNLRVKDFVNIIGLQFNVKWDTSALVFKEVKNEYPGLDLTPAMFFNNNFVAGGTLKFFGGDPGGWPNIPNGGTFFTVCFTVKNPNAATGINFEGPFDAVNSGFNSIPLTTINGFFKSVDLTPPTPLCPADTVVTATGSDCSAKVTLPNATGTDACSGIKTITNNQTDDIYPSGVTTVIFTVLDSAGNSANCSMTVTVQDTLPPQLANCPANVTVVAQQDCKVAVSWQAPQASDNCTNIPPQLSASASSGSDFPIGDSTVTFTAVDVFGTSATCSFIITVTDTVKPKVTCPADVVQISTNPDCSAQVNWSTALATDNCDQMVALSSDSLPGATFAVGQTIVTYTAMDNFGNTATCTFLVSVVDINPPALSACPDTITTVADANACGATVTWTAPTATDDCSANVTVIPSQASGSFFPVGTTVVTYEAKDLSGNTVSCSFIIQINETVPPVINNCPAGFVIELPDTECDTVLNWTKPTATDNCGLKSLTASQDPGTLFPTGIHTVVYTAVDSSGNTSTCSFLVAVNDNVPPVFDSCPADITVNDASPCGVVVDWAFPTATDNCQMDTITATRLPSDTLYNQLTNVLILASDASGNYDTCSFTIKLNFIAIPPSFSPAIKDTTILGCPQTVSWTPPGVTGFCDPSKVILMAMPDTIQPGDMFPLGATNIIYVAKDPSGTELLRDTFTVTIKDNTPPLIECPENPVVVFAGGVVLSDPDQFVDEIDTVSTCDGVRLSFGLPMASDNCGTPVVSQTDGATTGEVFSVDMHTLTFNTVDAAGNTASCSVEVTVLGLQALAPSVNPPVACPGNEVLLTVQSFPGATYTWTGPNQQYPNTPQITVIASPANAGIYTVFASINGCDTPLDSAEVVLASDPRAEDDVDYSVNPGVAIDTFNVLLNDIFAPPSDFEVKFDSLPSGVTYLGNGLFSFEGSEMPGSYTFFYDLCSKSCPDFCDMATVTINVRSTDCSFIPNVITPNGDDVNDYLTIPCLDSGLYEGNSLVIYNQWGDKVFDASGYTNNPLTAWRGTYNGESGKDLPDGVYFYIFKAGPNEPARKGFVEIYR